MFLYNQNQPTELAIQEPDAQQPIEKGKKQQPLPCKLEKQIVQLEKLLGKIGKVATGRKDKLKNDL